MKSYYLFLHTFHIFKFYSRCDFSLLLLYFLNRYFHILLFDLLFRLWSLSRRFLRLKNFGTTCPENSLCDFRCDLILIARRNVNRRTTFNILILFVNNWKWWFFLNDRLRLNLNYCFDIVLYIFLFVLNMINQIINLLFYIYIRYLLFLLYFFLNIMIRDSLFDRFMSKICYFL